MHWWTDRVEILVLQLFHSLWRWFANYCAFLHWWYHWDWLDSEQGHRHRHTQACRWCFQGCWLHLKCLYQILQFARFCFTPTCLIKSSRHGMLGDSSDTLIAQWPTAPRWHHCCPGPAIHLWHLCTQSKELGIQRGDTPALYTLFTGSLCLQVLCFLSAIWCLDKDWTELDKRLCGQRLPRDSTYYVRASPSLYLQLFAQSF